MPSNSLAAETLVFARAFSANRVSVSGPVVFGCFPSAMRHAALAPALAHPHAHPQNEKENKEREKEKQLYEGDCSASDIPGVWRQLQAPHVRAKATIFVQRAVSRNSVWRVTVPLLGG